LRIWPANNPGLITTEYGKEKSPGEYAGIANRKVVAGTFLTRY